jgi:hypothetical protein
MPPDFRLGDIDEFQPDRFALRCPLAGIDRKHLFAVEPVPVTTDDPAPRLLVVSASGPSPEALPQCRLHLLERPCRHDVAVIVRPAPKDRVELSDQISLVPSTGAANQPTSFLQKDMGILLGGLDEQFTPETAHGLAEEVEPILNVGDAGLLRREFQSPLAQELLDQRPDFILQQLFSSAGDDEVIRVPHKVHLGIVQLPVETLHTEVLFEQPLQSIQDKVCQGRRLAHSAEQNDRRIEKQRRDEQAREASDE